MDEILRRDLAVNWHPLLSHERARAGEVLAVTGAAGDHLILDDGRRVIDGISSWWCKLLGHQHPALREALVRQAGVLEHCIFANTTCAPLVQLSEMLCERIAGAERVLYACDGSSAVDMALKLSLFVHRRQGSSARRRFVKLENAYHGDSAGAMSVSDVETYTGGFDDLCFSSQRLTGVPYVSGRAHGSWHDAEAAFAHCRVQLDGMADTLAAIIIEPLLQGAGGMRVYSADFLARLCRWAQSRGVHVIADEIMTGMGRTGAWTALSIAGATADMVLLSKS
ncbi:MAG: aminotransferase class III-fold pyridoxal phosphate-dependent enzyme, partial [Proteobacteria bacterium]|nr:aminotransferase class III-fold pyridoxal phosphate-dependent enzyme [Pseudomonadota bacterium]